MSAIALVRRAWLGLPELQPFLGWWLVSWKLSQTGGPQGFPRLRGPVDSPPHHPRPKRSQDAFQNSLLFWCLLESSSLLLGSIFGPNLGPQIRQHRWKIDVETPSYVELVFSSIFHRFGDPTSIPRNPIGPSGLNYFYNVRNQMEKQEKNRNKIIVFLCCCCF